MFKCAIILVLITFFNSHSAEELASPIAQVLANETIAQTTTTTTVLDSVQPVITNHNLTVMYAKKESNVIVNGSSVSVGRNIAPEIQATASGSNALVLVIVSLIVAICVVGAVLGAIFVMKRRLFVWNLNGKKTDSESDGANGVLTNNSSENGSVNKCDAVLETKAQVVETNEVKENVQEEVKAEEAEQQQSNLVEQNATSSLVVNVLNELSSDVKLSENTKSTNNLSNEQVVDPEKQPLNNE